MVNGPARTLVEASGGQIVALEMTRKPWTVTNSMLERKLTDVSRNPFRTWRPDAKMICSFQIDDAILDGKFRGLFTAGRLIQDTTYLTPEDILKNISVENGIIEYVKSNDVAIIACNSSYDNYFHWCTQALPVIFIGLNRQHSRVKSFFVLPKLNKWQLESLELLGCTESMRYIVDKNDRQYYFKTVEFCDILTGSAAFSLSNVARHTYSALREAVPRGSHSRRKLYVSRTDASTRVMRNERELMDAIVKLGFEIVVPGNYSFSQQVDLFRSADFVVGPHGAGLTNIVFCDPDTVVYEILPEHYKNACFCNLATICRLRYWADCFTSIGEGLPNIRDWQSDTHQVIERICEISSIV